MVELEQVFFELSNEDRLSLMTYLSKTDATMTKISNQLSLNPPETSRHLNRLMEIQLVEKTPNGEYSLSGFGEIVLLFIPSLRFVSENSEYWQNHSFNLIPEHFMAHIGVLEGSKFIDDVVISLYEAEKIIKETKKHGFIVTDQVLMNILPVLPELAKKGIKLDVIFPMDADPHEDFYTSDEQNVNNRFFERTPLFLGVNESRALIGFNHKDGRVDHRVFVVSNEEGRQWCKDLFQYLWVKASTEIPEHLKKYD